MDPSGVRIPTDWSKALPGVIFLCKMFVLLWDLLWPESLSFCSGISKVLML
jgi:hypothetical protein